MGSATTEIVARLQLRADQFSSEGGRAMAELAARAKTTAQSVRTEFAQNFAEVNKLAEQALKLPRTASGSLDLSGEIAALRESAGAADRKAAVMRELAGAFQTASTSGRAVTESMRQEADAAMVGARASEADAGAIRQRILALEEVQRELSKTTGIVQAHTRAANDNVVSAGQQRQSMLMLGQQAQDFVVQTSNGASVAQAFSQQIGQAAFAIQGMGGALGRVGSFLTTWQGTLVVLGLTVLPQVISKILEHNDALQVAVDKLKDDAAEARVAAQAKAQFAGSIDGLVDALHDQDEALKKSADAERTAAEQANIAAREKRNQAIATREATIAELEHAKAMLAVLSTPGASDARLAPARDEVRAAIPALEATLAQARQALQDAERQLNVTRVDVAAEQAKIAADPVRALNKLYDDRIRTLKDEQREQARLGRQVGAASKQRLLDLEQEKKAALAAAEETAAAAKRAAGEKPVQQYGRSVSSAEASAIARAAGLQVNSADRSFDKQKRLNDDWVAAGRPSSNPVAKPGSSAHERGEALDIQMASGVTVKKIRDAFAAEGVRLTKVFAEQGHWHVEWKKSGEEARAQASAVREAEKAQRELATSLEQVLGKLDPAADAAREYVEQLSKIDQLVRAGKLTPETGLDDIRAAKEQMNSAQVKAANDSFRRIIGPEDVDAIDHLFDGAAGLIIDASRDASLQFSDAIRDAFGNAADLLGVRINGPIRALLQQGGIEGQSGAIAKSLLTGLGIKDKVTTTKTVNGVEITEHSLERLSQKVGSALSGAAYGQVGGSVFASITGGRENKLGSALGGVVGNEAGKALGGVVTKAIGGGLGKMLGSAAGPLGSIVGGIAGSLIGNLFRTAPKGSAGITVANGSISAGKASGNAADATSQAASLAGSVAQGLTQIADVLGAKITGATDVKIGTYDGKWRVNDHGGAIGGVKGSGAISFDTQEQAVSYAISDALKDGVLSGISSASLAILRSGQDLSTAIQKAVSIEQIPKDLTAMIDPVGAAIDSLNLKWQKTVAALNEGGASAEQIAQAQQLYDLQLQQVKTSTQSASATLKDFLTGLKVGSNSPYSLRDQEATATAALKPFLDQIGSGKAVDQAKYQSAAQTYLDIERQLYGSTQKYFDALDAVQAATNKAISTIDNATPIAGSVDSPFVKATADSTAKTADAVQTGNEIAAQNTDLLARMTSALEKLAAGGVDDAGFIGLARAFAA